MVHWPEAMVTFDTTNGALFSADAFGSFGALDGKLFADEVNFDRDWIDDARRYLTNIVGKYGPHVQLQAIEQFGICGQFFEMLPVSDAGGSKKKIACFCLHSSSQSMLFLPAWTTAWIL